MSAAAGGGKKVRSRVEDERISKAVDSLLRWLDSQKSGRMAELVEDDELLYVVVSMKKVPEIARTNPYRIPLPHPLFPLDGSQEVCLFVSDRESGMKQKEAKERVAQEGIAVQKVVALSKLKKNYFAYEAKRKLCGSYDLFLADDRILSELPKCLGKTFFKKKKHPIPVRLSRGHWKGQITAACSSTFFYLARGTCSVIKAARVAQPRDEIRDNILAIVEGVANLIPKKWSNIQSIYLKTLESLSLPLYQALPDLPLKIEVGRKSESQDLGISTEGIIEEGTSKERLSKEIVGKEGLSKESKSKEGISKKSKVKEETSKESNVKERTSKESKVKEGTCKESKGKEGILKESNAKEGIPKETNTKKNKTEDRGNVKESKAAVEVESSKKRRQVETPRKSKKSRA